MEHNFVSSEDIKESNPSISNAMQSVNFEKWSVLKDLAAEEGGQEVLLHQEQLDVVSFTSNMMGSDNSQYVM